MNTAIVRLITACFLVVIAFPVIILLIWSCTNAWPWPAVMPAQWSLRGWQSLLTASGQVVTALTNSIGVSLAVTALTLALSLPAARAVACAEFSGRRFVKLFFLSPLLIPLTSIGMGIHINFIYLGLADTLPGVILINVLPCLPYALQIFMDLFAVLGDRYEQQARLLGANGLQVFFYITLPLVWPGIVAAGTIVFIIAFSDFFLTFLIGGGTVVTYATLLFPVIQNGDRTLSAAFSLLFIVILLCWIIILELFSRYYRKRRYFFS